MSNGVHHQGDVFHFDGDLEWSNGVTVPVHFECDEGMRSDEL